MPPKNTQQSVNMSVDQRSELSDYRGTPARSQYTNRRFLNQGTVRRTGIQSVHSPTRMTVEGEDHQVHYWGTNIDEEVIKQNFYKFITEYRSNEGELVYMTKLNQLMEIEEFTLIVDAIQLGEFNRFLYNQLVYFPAEVIPIFDVVVSRVFFEQFLSMRARSEHEREQYEQQSQRLIVGVNNLQRSARVRELNPKDINHLVQVRGIVIRCSEIYPEMKQAYFRCSGCQHSRTVTLERGRIEEPQQCEQCKQKQCLELVHNLCQFTDKQFVKMQESPESVPEGDTPQTVSLMAYDDNVDHIKPGDRIVVTGVYRAQGIRQMKNQRVLKSVYNTYVDVISYVKERQNEHNHVYNEEVRAKLIKLANSPDIHRKLMYSLAPSIWEQDDIKTGLLCQLFGGANKEFSQTGKGRFRAEINVLLVGDPSTSKSQFLKYVHQLSSRGIYTSGKGSSAVGLTVYVTRDSETKEIVLESGALVLSDMGICCIDEFDKMDDNAKTILHEAMEQQTISVAKAGIVSQLNARTAVLAAANPVHSRYDVKKSVVQNINLPPTLLSRFDLIYLVLDEQQKEKDQKLAYHILNLYSSFDKQTQLKQLQDEAQENLIDRETLSQYIAYSRLYITPKLTPEAEAELIKAYVEMRSQGMSQNTITATPRQLESLIRLSEALAKMSFNQLVTLQHVQEAVRLMQVATKRAAMDPLTGLIDMDLIATGTAQSSRQLIAKIMEILKDMIKANQDQFRQDGGMRFYDLLNKVNQHLGEQQMEEEQPTQRRNNNNEVELREALHMLADEDFVVLYGDHNRPKVRPGNAAIKS